MHDHDVGPTFEMDHPPGIALEVPSLHLVFARLEGRPFHPDLFSKTFDRMVARSSLPVIRLHDLRHGHASRC